MASNFPYIPETITVHLGSPDSDAQNVTVNFSDYIKNVASSEIYPTWPESALRANILAQISFALNRVYTEYYRSRGYSFNITNSTAFDQSFVNGRNVFDSISYIVDEIFNDYLRRQGTVEPLFAVYCNGTTVTCDGLSQWGSVDLAEDGQNSVEIIRSYYGDDTEIVTDAPVQGITSSVPSRTLRLGSVGNDVLAIQLRLNRISVNFPSIPKIPNTEGLFDIATDNAVRQFQTVFDLVSDGIVGKATWYAVQRIYAGVKRLNELSSEGIRYEDIPLVYPEVLSAGMSGEGVATVQYLLSLIAAYEDTVPTPSSGGYFDDATVESVIGFQKTYGLTPDGIVNEKTYARIFDVYYSLVLSIPESSLQNTARPYPGFVLSLGATGEFVTSLQEYLSVISGAINEIPAVEITGTFDAQTEAAVTAVQRLSDIPETGRVNRQTWIAIADLYDDIAAGQTVAQGQYPGVVLEEENSNE